MVKLTFYIYREINRALSDLEFELTNNKKLTRNKRKELIKRFTERATFQIKENIEEDI